MVWIEPATFLAAAALAALGLLVGSFLNVVIHRLPQIIERNWIAECQAAQDPADHEHESTQATLSLPFPRSGCPHCGHPIGWLGNIPVLSYIALRGRCAHCRQPIGLRYPAVELACAALFAWCGWRWGLGTTALVWCGFSAALLCLAAIDWETTLLPDDITLPLVWAGLCAAALGLSGTSLPHAVWGAVAGYLSLWLLYWVFKLATGKEGMGYGDFKLLAALGAWLGVEALAAVVLIASITGSVVGIAMKLRSTLREGVYVPFGPFLAFGGFVVLWFGEPLMRWLRLV